MNDDTAIARYVHNYLLKNIGAIGVSNLKYTDCTVSRLFPPGGRANTGPRLEARSVRPELTVVETAVTFNKSQEEKVNVSGEPFEITSNWWKILSEGASIYVLPELTRSRSPAEYFQFQALDALTHEVSTGMSWAKYYFLADSHTGWSETQVRLTLNKAVHTPRNTRYAEIPDRMDTSSSVDPNHSLVADLARSHEAMSISEEVIQEEMDLMPPPSGSPPKLPSPMEL